MISNIEKRSVSERNALVEENMSFAENLARQRHRTVNRTVQLSDLVSAAYCGLIDAASRYDENKVSKMARMPFTAYARARICGAMNDYLRSCNWGTRSTPRKVKSLELQLGAMDHAKQISHRELLISNEPQSIDELNGSDFFQKVLKGVPKDAKQAFTLYFLYGKNMKQVAQELNLSESRISQLISTHTAFLKETLAETRYELWEEVAASK